MVSQCIFGVERNLDIPVGPTQAELNDLDELLPGSEHGWFESCYKKAQLHYRKWLPKHGKPKAIVVCMHGIQAHCSYAFVLEGRKLNMALVSHAYTEQGYAVYAFDHYGHGFSEGERFWIPDSWENNMQDYINFCNFVTSMHDDNIPLFLHGESYGSTLTINVAKQFQDDPSVGPKNFDSIILVCPAIVADLPPFPIYFTLRYILAPILPKSAPFFMPNTLGPARMWRDPEVRDLHEHCRWAELQIQGSGTKLRLGTAANLVAALEQCRVVIPTLKVPFFIAHGTCDYGVPIAGSEFMWSNAQTPEAEREFHRIEGAYHDLFADPEAERVIEMCLNWTKMRLGKKE